MLLSVIIPTYNRCEILKECLTALFHQTLPKRDYEVIVVDDGSKDNTKATVKKLQKKHSNLFYFYKKNQGQGIARNFGFEKAKGGVVVFIGDDIIVIKDFLNEHLRYHLRFTRENEAVLGFITWHPKLVINSFMRWMTNGSAIFGRFGGHQFAYEKLAGKTEADFNFFYTSNISLKREIIEKKEDQFDSDFGSYGWEDIELGYRLYKKYGLKIFYNEKALGYHYHELDESTLERRMFMIGKSAHIIHSKHPELNKVPGKIKQICFRILGSLPVIGFIWSINKFTKNKFLALYFYALSKRYFMKGFLSR